MVNHQPWPALVPSFESRGSSLQACGSQQRRRLRRRLCGWRAMILLFYVRHLLGAQRLVMLDIVYVCVCVFLCAVSEAGETAVPQRAAAPPRPTAAVAEALPPEPMRPRLLLLCRKCAPGPACHLALFARCGRCRSAVMPTARLLTRDAWWTWRCRCRCRCRC